MHMISRAPVGLLLLLLACDPSNDPKNDDTDAASAADSVDTPPGDDSSTPTDSGTPADSGTPTDSGNATDTGDTGGTDTGDTSAAAPEFVGCEGATGTCEGLSGRACEVSGLLGCNVTFALNCFQEVYCIDVFDGCPQQFCTGSGDTCAWRNDADRVTAQACFQSTTCASVLCQSLGVTCSATGAWSCDLDFSGLPSDQRPAASVCADFDALGFACTPLFD